MRISPAPQLSGAQYLLRPVEPTDVEAFFAMLCIPEVIEHTSWNVKSYEELLSIIDGYNSNTPGSSIQFAIVEQSTNKFVGVTGFHTISVINRTAELSYTLHPSYWGQGLATNCCQTLIKWGFDSAHFVRIQATTLDTNKRSARVLEKCGFELEGKLRKFRVVRGEPRDFSLYAKINYMQA